MAIFFKSKQHKLYKDAREEWLSKNWGAYLRKELKNELQTTGTDSVLKNRDNKLICQMKNFKENSLTLEEKIIQHYRRFTENFRTLEDKWKLKKIQEYR